MSANNIKNIAAFLNIPISKLSFNSDKMLTCTINNEPITGFINIISTLLEQSKAPLFGADSIENAEIRQWLEYCVIYTAQSNNTQNLTIILQELNQFLAVRSYFVGNSLTIADIALFYVLHDAMEKITYLDKEKYLNVSRWYDNIQQNNDIRSKKALIDFSTIYLSSITVK